MGRHVRTNSSDQLRRDAEYSTEQGATILARTINRYWQRRGFMPNVIVKSARADESPSDAMRPHFVIRSDMIGGRPRL